VYDKLYYQDGLYRPIFYAVYAILFFDISLYVMTQLKRRKAFLWQDRDVSGRKV